MKNIIGLLMLPLFVFACSSTKNDLKSSTHRAQGRQSEVAAAMTSVGNGNSGNSRATASPVYASTAKVISLQENNVINSPSVAPTLDEIRNQKITQAQMEIVRRIEMDKVVSFVALKKGMQQKVVTTELTTFNDSASSIVLSRDTVYSTPQSNTWHTVE